MIQGFTRCASNATYTLPSSILVSGTVLRPVSLLRSSSSSPRLRIDYSTSNTQTMPVLFFVNFFQDDVFSATCKWLIDKCLTLFRVVKMPTLKSVKSLCHRVLRGTPLALRTRYRSPSSSPEPSFILVFSPVHRIRHRNRPPSPFSADLFFGCN